MDKELLFSNLVFFVLCVLLCGGIYSCRKWEYDECLKAGHGKSYCVAYTLGCFEGGRR